MYVPPMPLLNQLPIRQPFPHQVSRYECHLIYRILLAAVMPTGKLIHVPR